MIRLREPFLAYPSALEMGTRFAARLGITGDDQLPRLRAMRAEHIYELARADELLGGQYPVIDGHVLPESPLAAFAAGRQAPVPLLIGSNADEGTIIRAVFGAPMVEYRHLPVPERSMQPEMAEAFGDDLDRLLACYPGLERRDERAEIEFLGDHLFGGRVYHYARHHRAAGHPAYLYLFTRTPPSDRQTAGAFHAAELPFVHGVRAPGVFPMTAADEALSIEMMRHWTDFAAQGDPNRSPDQPEWPVFDPDDPRWMRLDHTIEAAPVDRRDRYEILNARTDRLVAQMASLAGG